MVPRQTGAANERITDRWQNQHVDCLNGITQRPPALQYANKRGQPYYSKALNDNARALTTELSRNNVDTETAVKKP